MEPLATEPSPAQPRSQLTRSRDDRVIAGVCGGLGRYFGLDPVLLRVAAVILVLFGGTGLLAYLILWIVIPEETVASTHAAREAASASTSPPTAPAGSTGASVPTSAAVPVSPRAATGGRSDARGAMVFGVILIGIGALLLLDRLLPGLSWRYTGPLLLIVIGVFVLAKGGGRR